MTAKHDHSLWDKFSSDSGETQWCSDKQELTIDLSKLLGESVSLILTGWQHNHGISWGNVIDGETEQHTNPFEDSLFPINFISHHEMLQPWREQIPDAVIERLKIYKGNAFGMLSVCSRYQYIEELFSTSPTLFWLTFMTAQHHNWSEAEFVNTCQLKQTEILNKIDLPAKKSALKLLNKIKARHYGQREFELITELFMLDYQFLNHRSTVSVALMKLLTHFPELINSKLLHNWNEDDNIQMLREYIQDIERMVYRIGLDRKITIKKLCDCKNINCVQRLHDELVALFNKKMAALIKRKGNKELISHFPAPPLTGNEDIIPITSYQQLQQESQQLHHCVASYDQDIALGDCYIYQVLKPERSTLSIKIRNTLSGQSRFRIGQLKGYRNKTVDNETRETVLLWFNQVTHSSTDRER